MHLSKSEMPPIPSAPPDPILLGARGDRRLNYNSATGRRLFHQSHMPLGRHAGKIMERVPAAYLVEFYDCRYAEMSTQQRKDWYPVWCYCDTHIKDLRCRVETELVLTDLKPKLPREYTLRLKCTLISLTAAATSQSPHHKCEICHDIAGVKCDCDPVLKNKRNMSRASYVKRKGIL